MFFIEYCRQFKYNKNIIISKTHHRLSETTSYLNQWEFSNFNGFICLFVNSVDKPKRTEETTCNALSFREYF